MIDCYCCERREVTGILAVNCYCDNCFCTECLLCSQHCQCAGSDPQSLRNDEFASPEPERLWIDPESFYPGADAPTVIPR